MLNTIKHHYVKAIRTALIAQDNLTQKWFHVFSVIELQPAEMPIMKLPDPSWFQQKIVRSTLSSKHNSFTFSLIVHDFTTVDEALETFNTIKTGQVLDGIPNYYFNTYFSREPAGQFPLVIGTGSEKDGLAAALPKYNSGSLVWAQIDSERVTELQFRSEMVTQEMKEMSQLTNDWLGFNIWEMPEHIGNIYLQAVNPYFREIDLTLSDKPTGIFYRIYYRQGITEQLTYRLTDWRGNHIGLDQTGIIKDTAGFIELPHEPNTVELRLYNERGHLIGLKGPFTFLKSIQFNMQIKHADFVLKVQDENGVKEIVTEKFSGDRPITIGKNPEINIAYYFKSAEENRKHISLAETREFIFFASGRNNEDIVAVKDSVRKVIREIISRAQDVCFFCDPYFATPDLIDYVFTIKNSNVKVQILNRRGGAFVDVAKAKALSEAIKLYNEKPFQKIECRMLKQNLLHDRFIIADNQVWFLGSSFNEIGGRSTCIGKVPQSVDTRIIKEIESWFYNDNLTQSVDDYLTEQNDA